MSSKAVQHTEISAGGVVVHGDQMVVIVPKRRSANGARVLGLPKGHIDPGETDVQAAIREVREEAGVTATLAGKLGEVRYRYRRNGLQISKLVSFFLLDYLSGDPQDHDDEVERALWMPLQQAAIELTYEGERRMVTNAIAALAGSHPLR